jgi:hypothetical protein
MASIQLLTADASELVLGALLQPPWGVFLAGVPVIQPASFLTALAAPVLGPIAAIASFLGVPNLLPAAASTVEFEFTQDFPISNYPQEQGGFQSYNKVSLPFDVKLRLAASGSPSSRQAFLSACLAIAGAPAPIVYSVVTPELTFTNVSCTHIDWRRRPTEGNTLIQVDLWFKAIPTVSLLTSFLNTIVPGISGQVGLGNIQPTTPFAGLQSAISALTVL